MKSIFKLAFAALLLVGMTAQLSAQTDYTLTNSAWNNPAGWTPSYPGTTVAAGNTITITGNCNIPSGVIVNVSCDVDIVHHGFSLFGTAEYHQLAGTLTLGPHTTVNNIWQGPINEIAAGATFVNEGEVRLGNGGVTNLDGEIIINGSIASNQFNSSGNNVVSNITGNVSGTGGYNGANSGGSTTFSGTVSPGEGGIGCLGFFPTAQTAAAVTNIEANGTTACTEHDRITGVNGGDFAPAGTLNFTVAYTPVDGDVIHFYSNTNSMITGAYDAVNAPSGWAIEYNSPSNGNISMVFDESTVVSESEVACENPYPTNGVGVVGGETAVDGVLYGQSIVADATCLGGPDFSEFSFYTSGNGFANVDVRVYNGETVSGTPMYSEEGFSFQAGGNVGTLQTIVFGTGSNGTGSLSYVDGQTYTFLLETTSSLHLYGMTADNIAGKAYTAGAFDASLDLITGIAGTNPSPVACDNPYPTNGVGVVGGETAVDGVLYGQSIVADAACLGGPDFSEFSFYTSGNGFANVDVRVYNGETVSGTPMYSEEVFSFQAGGNAGTLQTIVFGTGSNATGSLSYVDGQTYTFLLETTSSLHLYGMTADNIAGKAYTAGAFDANLDLITSISGGAVTEPVPTMGEWALITFGLIIMSMGVITVRRREEDLIAQAA